MFVLNSKTFIADILYRDNKREQQQNCKWLKRDEYNDYKKIKYKII